MRLRRALNRADGFAMHGKAVARAHATESLTLHALRALLGKEKARGGSRFLNKSSPVCLKEIKRHF